MAYTLNATRLSLNSTVTPNWPALRKGWISQKLQRTRSYFPSTSNQKLIVFTGKTAAGWNATVICRLTQSTWMGRNWQSSAATQIYTQDGSKKVTDLSVCGTDENHSVFPVPSPSLASRCLKALLVSSWQVPGHLPKASFGTKIWATADTHGSGSSQFKLASL